MEKCGAPGSMDCGEVFEKMQDFLDRELTAAEVEDVARHLGLCGHCADEYKFEGSVLRHMRRCCKDVPVPEALGSAVFQKITD